MIIQQVEVSAPPVGAFVLDTVQKRSFQIDRRSKNATTGKILLYEKDDTPKGIAHNVENCWLPAPGDRVKVFEYRPYLAIETYSELQTAKGKQPTLYKKTMASIEELIKNPFLYLPDPELKRSERWGWVNALVVLRVDDDRLYLTCPEFGLDRKFYKPTRNDPKFFGYDIPLSHCELVETGWSDLLEFNPDHDDELLRFEFEERSRSLESADSGAIEVQEQTDLSF